MGFETRGFERRKATFFKLLTYPYGI